MSVTPALRQNFCCAVALARYRARPTTEAIAKSMNDVLLEVRNFKVILDGTLILSDLNFTVDEGEFLTILGPNGAGKTVLVKALLNLVPYTGELRWHKKPKIGYLPQGLNQTSVRDMPLTVKDFFALKKLQPDQVLNNLALVGLQESVLGKGPATFPAESSKGCWSHGFWRRTPACFFWMNPRRLSTSPVAKPSIRF